MIKKKGFTLVELLAVLVILGILVLIAIPSYNVISNNVKRKQNANKISYIETQAAKYVTESGLYSDIDEASITVQTLLQNGYLDGDNKLGDVVQDAYGNDITCYQIKIVFEKGKPIPEFVDEDVINEDGVCILNSLKSQKILELSAYKVGSLNENNKLLVRNNRTYWVSEDVLLKLKINDAELNSKRDQAIVNIDWNAVNNNKSYSQTNDNWYTVGWLDNITSYNSNTDYKNTYLVSTNKIMAETKFKVSLVVNYINDAGKRINETLTTYLVVRIDKEAPTVTATADTNWTKGNKKIFMTGNDKQGSGIDHFCIFDSEVTNHTCAEGSAAYVATKDQNSNKGEVNKPAGTYYIWTVDKVGNYSTNSARVVVSNIDTTPPTCVYENQNTTWKKGTHTITVKCNDGSGGSGCITKPYTATFPNNQTYSSTNLTTSYIITDYAGNKTVCSGPVNVYIDNNNPVISEITHLKGSTTITVTDTGELDKYEIIKDGSVIKTVTLSGTSSTTTYSNATAGSYTVKVYDKAGNTKSGSLTIPSHKATFYSNLVTNNDFSNTTGLGWKTIGSTAAVDTSVKNGSLNSMKISTTGSGYDGIATVYQPNFKANTTYRLSLKAYRNSGASTGDLTKDFRVYAPELNSSNSVVNYNHGITINSSNLPNKTWKEFSYTFTTGASSVAFQYVRLDFKNVSGNATIWVSDVKLEEVVTKDLSYNQALGTLPTTTRAGHVSGGYYTGENGSGSAISTTTKISDSDVNYYEKWTSNTYRVDLNGILDGASKGNIANYGTADVYVNGTRVADDATDYCIEYPFGSYYEVKDIKTNSGKAFKGNSSYSGYVGAANAAVYLPYETKYVTVTFKANGGSGNDSVQTFTYGTANQSFANPGFSRSGYIQGKWAETADGSGVYSITSGVSDGWIDGKYDANSSHTVTLYATWSPSTIIVIQDGVLKQSGVLSLNSYTQIRENESGSCLTANSGSLANMNNTHCANDTQSFKFYGTNAGGRFTNGDYSTSCVPRFDYTVKFASAYYGRSVTFKVLLFTSARFYTPAMKFYINGVEKLSSTTLNTKVEGTYTVTIDSNTALRFNSTTNNGSNSAWAPATCGGFQSMTIN